jgi:uncharacterized damage-inducible protein DinB
MTVKDWLVPEFDHEIALTRQVLERTPESHFAWKPHARSFSMGELATHLSTLLRWGLSILEHDAYDVAAEPGAPPAAAPTQAAMLEAVDRQAGAVRRALADRADGELQAPWSLRRGDHVLMTMPRFSAMRRFVLNHLVHHRGQMTVYLRLQDVPLPPIYGPTADER